MLATTPWSLNFWKLTGGHAVALCPNCQNTFVRIEIIFVQAYYLGLFSDEQVLGDLKMTHTWFDIHQTSQCWWNMGTRWWSWPHPSRWRAAPVPPIPQSPPLQTYWHNSLRGEFQSKQAVNNISKTPFTKDGVLFVVWMTENPNMTANKATFPLHCFAFHAPRRHISPKLPIKP